MIELFRLMVSTMQYPFLQLVFVSSVGDSDSSKIGDWQFDDRILIDSNI